MGELRRRFRVLLDRLRAGEGVIVLAELGETAAVWLANPPLPLPERLRPPVARLGGLLGELMRPYRQGPVEIPPPGPSRQSAVLPSAALPGPAASEACPFHQPAEDPAERGHSAEVPDAAEAAPAVAGAREHDAVRADRPAGAQERDVASAASDAPSADREAAPDARSADREVSSAAPDARSADREASSVEDRAVSSAVADMRSSVADREVSSAAAETRSSVADARSSAADREVSSAAAETHSSVADARSGAADREVSSAAETRSSVADARSSAADRAVSSVASGARSAGREVASEERASETEPTRTGDRAGAAEVRSRNGEEVSVLAGETARDGADDAAAIDAVAGLREEAVAAPAAPPLAAVVELPRPAPLSERERAEDTVVSSATSAVEAVALPEAAPVASNPAASRAEATAKKSDPRRPSARPPASKPSAGTNGAVHAAGRVNGAKPSPTAEARKDAPKAAGPVRAKGSERPAPAAEPSKARPSARASRPNLQAVGAPPQGKERPPKKAATGPTPAGKTKDSKKAVPKADRRPAARRARSKDADKTEKPT